MICSHPLCKAYNLYHSKSDELWWARVKIIIHRFEIVIIILMRLHFALDVLLCIQSFFIVVCGSDAQKECYLCASLIWRTRMQQHVSINSDLFPRKFYPFVCRFQLRWILYVYFLFFSTTSIENMMTFKNFFHVTGNYNQLNQFPALFRKKTRRAYPHSTVQQVIALWSTHHSHVEMLK